MVSVCTVPARGGRSCERFGGYKTINRIPFTFTYGYDLGIKQYSEKCLQKVVCLNIISVN